VPKHVVIWYLSWTVFYDLYCTAFYSVQRAQEFKWYIKLIITLRMFKCSSIRWRCTRMSLCTNIALLYNGNINFTHCRLRGAENTHTHTHTHTYIYIYIYRAFHNVLRSYKNLL
jgi:hypothetical protein